MNRYAALIATCLIFLFGFTPLNTTTSTNDAWLANKIIASSVSFHVNEKLFGGGKYWATVGSATVVKHKKKLYVVTAKHVADGVDIKDVKFCSAINGMNCFQTKSNFVSPPFITSGLDWAYTEIEKLPNGIRPVKFNTKVHFPGTSVKTFGFPNGFPFYSTGQIAWVDRDFAGKQYYWIDGFAYPGSSGGGVFDTKGNLVGLVTSISVWPGMRDYFGNTQKQLMENAVHIVPVTNIDIVRKAGRR